MNPPRPPPPPNLSIIHYYPYAHSKVLELFFNILLTSKLVSILGNHHIDHRLLYLKFNNRVVLNYFTALPSLDICTGASFERKGDNIRLIHKVFKKWFGVYHYILNDWVVQTISV